jgi:hypothetical protein
VLGAATDRRRALAGTSVALTARVLNPSARVVSGEVFADADSDALSANARGQRFSVSPGETWETKLPLRVARDAKEGYYLAQAVARLDGGRTVRSPSLEVRVVPAFTLKVSPEDQTLYPETDGGQVTADLNVNSRDLRGRVELRIEGAEGFPVDARKRAIQVDGGRDAYQATFAFKPCAQENRVEEGRLVVEGRIGGLPLRRELPLRVARGCVAYREKRVVRMSNSSQSETKANLVTLENSRIKVRIIPQTAVVHELVLRETNNDVLAEGTYPFGLVWYAWKGGWSLKEVSPSGPETRAVFRSRGPDGKPVTMTATLRRGESYCAVVYDASAVRKPTPQSFYLMSRLGKGGTHADNLMHIPTRKRVVKRLWRKARGFKEFDARNLSEPWLAVTNPANNQVFSVSYVFDALDCVRVSSGAAGFNYMVFRPLKDRLPGRIVFRLAAQPGGQDEAVELQRKLIKEGK